MRAYSGSIPACLTALPELVELHLDFNQLTSTIPAFPLANSPLVYFSAAFQARKQGLGSLASHRGSLWSRQLCNRI